MLSAETATSSDIVVVIGCGISEGGVVWDTCDDVGVGVGVVVVDDDAVVGAIGVSDADVVGVDAVAVVDREGVEVDDGTSMFDLING